MNLKCTQSRPRVHFSAFQPHRQDLPIRFGQRLQKLFYVNLCGDIVLELRVLVGMEQPGFRTVYHLVYAQHLRESVVGCFVRV